MTIYLYKKTHNVTGLQYLGKTTRNPFTYKGSGVYWSKHIKKHGYDVTTVILKECETNDEVKKWGLYYSNLWNIVENKSWANLIPESGEGGNIIKDKTILGVKKVLDKRKNRHAVNQAKFSAKRSLKGSKKRELIRSKLTHRQCQTLPASPQRR
jgi:hypothetical protein